MNALGATLAVLLGALPPLAFSGVFHDGFEIPKLLSVYALGVAVLAFLATRAELLLPGRHAQGFLLAAALTVLVSGLRSPVGVNTILALAGLACLVAVYLFVLNADARTRTLLLATLLGLAVGEALVALAQATRLDAWLPGYLLYGRQPVIGTLGNEEFLATLLGVGFFVARHLEAATGGWRRFALWAVMALLLVALVAAHNKGALLFIALYFLWRRWPRPGRLGLAALAGAAVIAGLFPESMQGRALLWLAATGMFLAHPFAGLGPGQFENGYLDAVHVLFTQFPAWTTVFTDNAAKVQDAHNLILQHAAEYGFAGLVLAALLAVHVVRQARRTGGALAAGLLLLLFKSLYTVVLGAVTSALLFVILLALATPRAALTSGSMRPARRAFAVAAVALLAGAAAWVQVGDLYHERGLRALMRGEPDAARTQFARALRHHPQQGDTWLALAQLHFQRHDTPALRTALQQALAYKREINTTKIAAHIYFFSGHYDEAERLYAYLHVIYPTHLTTLARLALIAQRRADYTLAHWYATQLLDTPQSREKWSDAINRATARRILQQTTP